MVDLSAVVKIDEEQEVAKMNKCVSQGYRLSPILFKMDIEETTAEIKGTIEVAINILE